MNTKILFALLIMAFLSGSAFAQKYDKENPDLVNYSLDVMKLPPTSVVINGEFTDTDGVLFGRTQCCGTYYDPTCSGAAWTPTANNTFYDVYTFTANSDGVIDATLTTNIPGCCSTSDMYLMLYCSNFDPTNVLNNLRATDDDSGIGFNSAFMPAAGVQLVAGQVYQIVVTNFGDISGYSAPVPYELVINSDISMGGGGAPVPLSNWSIIGSILAILITTVFILRKRLF